MRATPEPARRVVLRAEVVVYTRPGCHLCEVVEAQLQRLREVADFRWRVVNVDGDPAPAARYGQRVPVVCIDGREAFRYRLDEQRFLRLVRRAG